MKPMAWIKGNFRESIEHLKPIQIRCVFFALFFIRARPPSRVFGHAYIGLPLGSKVYGAVCGSLCRDDGTIICYGSSRQCSKPLTVV